jgi:hypothetical protein
VLPADHQVVGQQHGKGLVAHGRTGAQHGMPQAQSHRLAHKDAVDVSGQDVLHHVQQLQFALGLQLSFQFGRCIKVVFDGALVASCHKNQVGHACGNGFFYGVLNERFVHHGQHFFRAGFGGGQKARAKTCNREYGFADGFHSVTCLGCGQTTERFPGLFAKGLAPAGLQGGEF